MSDAPEELQLHDEAEAVAAMRDDLVELVPNPEKVGFSILGYMNDKLVSRMAQN